MKMYYMVDDVIQHYGPEMFYTAIRGVICDVLAGSELEIDDFAVGELYQRFGFAWIIATKANDPSLIHELMLETTYETNDAGEMIEVVSFLNTVGTMEQHYAAAALAHGIFQNGIVSKSAIADMLKSVAPMRNYNAISTTDDHYKTILALYSGLKNESSESAMLCALIESLFPGKLLTYYGDDYTGSVLVCEIENDFIPGLGRFLSNPSSRAIHF